MDNSTFLIPTGAILAFASHKAPEGWLICNGDELRIEDYRNLYEVIGDTFNRTNTPEGFFCLPDLQGQFIRGWDKDGNIDSQRDFSSSQEDAFQGHKHSFILKDNTTTESGEHSHCFKTNRHLFRLFTMLSDDEYAHYIYDDPRDGNKQVSNSGVHTHQLPEMHIGDAQNSIFDPIKVDNETRPRNIALLYCIKY